jgi:hypothetical protein
MSGVLLSPGSYFIVYVQMYGLVVRISACNPGGPGSIPGNEAEKETKNKLFHHLPPASPDRPNLTIEKIGV